MMHALVLLCRNQHTTFEVPNFTDFKDYWWPKLNNGSRDHGHTH